MKIIDRETGEISVRRHRMGPRVQQVPISGQIFIDADEDHRERARELSEEITAYLQVMLGREDPPVNYGVMTLMEVAHAYYARGREIEMEILHQERENVIAKNSALYKFRTGELRSFLELTKRAIDLGSRRLTHEQLLHDKRYEYDGDDHASEGS